MVSFTDWRLAVRVPPKGTNQRIPLRFDSLIPAAGCKRASARVLSSYTQSVHHKAPAHPPPSAEAAESPGIEVISGKFVPRPDERVSALVEIAGAPNSRLLLDGLEASARRRAAGEVYEVFVRASRSHRAQAPVTGGGVDAGEPRGCVLRSGAVGILGTEALAGLGVMLSGAHARLHPFCGAHLLASARVD